MKRILTALVSAPLALAGVFWLPDGWFFVVLLAISLLATIEFKRMISPRDAGGSAVLLFLLVPLAAVLMTPIAAIQIDPLPLGEGALLVACALVLGVGSIVVLSRVPVTSGLSAIGTLLFGVLYFSIPVASLFRLRQLGGPWIVVLCLIVVWVGDIAAFYCGSKWGRSKLAETISPNKTVEGSVAGLFAGLAAAAIWSLWIHGTIGLRILSLAVVIAAAAQLGDLVESLFKRGAGVKDSGSLFPGHGGVMDRLDALFFAAPAAWIMIWLMGKAAIVP